MPAAPKFDPTRRHARVGPMTLPSGGRSGPLPAWPVVGAMRAGEKSLWRDLWATPQAAAWERQGWTRVVARYCRVVVAAEASLDNSLLSEARLLENELGLTPKAMRLMLWTVAEDEVAEKRTASTARKRIKAV